MLALCSSLWVFTLLRASAVMHLSCFMYLGQGKRSFSKRVGYCSYSRKHTGHLKLHSYCCFLYFSTSGNFNFSNNPAGSAALVKRTPPLAEMTVEETVKYAFCSFTGPSEAMVDLHTHFALLYLRGGLCWDWGLACRRSTAIFTSANKSIQTLNKTMTCKSACVFTRNGAAASNSSTIQMKVSSITPSVKSKLDEAKMQQIELPNLCDWVLFEQ